MELTQSKENPFDRDVLNIPLIRILLHSSSLSRELLSGDSVACRLVRLNYFKEIEVIPLPTDNNDVRKILDANDLVSTEYYLSESGVALKASDGSIYAVANQPHYDLSNLWEPVLSGSSVTRADIYASGRYDYFVVGADDPILTRKVAKDNYNNSRTSIRPSKSSHDCPRSFLHKPSRTTGQ